jgi:hypothetical protein
MTGNHFIFDTGIFDTGSLLREYSPSTTSAPAVKRQNLDNLLENARMTGWVPQGTRRQN